ncbi:hypothetical protein A1Q1_05967 [Trichosporon asahii var. asahii CBS 2479]|uniref:Gfd2/YDR514C-like C-terminal domain-containing protein n=1 Tax=Trichosporon asahii var. asahii (strain ATCC 90039 / CBS 2479 / JCM 2466 / KCTC 7840 / NBRC 103889/ NCYC 2677 / UAMH 7654) TaxID=1186058 RepID=J5SGL7_TRIAS|nr:hypothetical protein A1Q1_05967 [Trichosporon asahii var. asahii CBS 2479]EJT45521.1 hypothetical protein A1Q1_05967 [Trichosporon asahii var. asahii CBS 2479]
MGDNTRYGNPSEFDIDLHSIYAAYLGDFDAQNIDWWDASWGGYFRSFNDFLGFGWEAMARTDDSFGETLDREPPSLLPLTPAPARNRTLHRVVNIHDIAGYKKLSTTMAPAELSHLRARVRAGEPGVIGALFHAGSPDPDAYAATAGVRTNGQGYTWACLRTTWWDRGGPPQGYVPGHGRTVMAKPGQGGKALILELGLAALRCANLRAVRMNTERPNYPRAFGFGRSAFVSEKSVERIVDASLGALASHDSEGGANTLVLLSVGEPQPIPLPATTTLQQNILQLDVLQLEFALLQQAQRQGVPGVGDRRQPLGSLRQLLHHLQIPVAPHAPLGNAGNEAFYTVLAFQKLLMRDTRLPDQLFQQPAFAQPTDYFVPPAMPAFAPAPYSPFNSPGAGLPMPPPIRDGSRRRDRRRSRTRCRLPAARASLDAARQPGRGSANGNGSAASPTTGIPRSQTVYWDEAKYSEGGKRPPSAAARANGTSLSGSRGPNPPSSLRHSALFPGNMAGSRSVSFHGAHGNGPNGAHSGGASTIRSQESANGSGSFSRTNSGSMLQQHTRGSSVSGNSGSGSASASSGSGATSEASLTKPQNQEEPDRTSNERAVRKMKSEKSVKHLAGALAKFWVD